MSEVKPPSGGSWIGGSGGEVVSGTFGFKAAKYGLGLGMDKYCCAQSNPVTPHIEAACANVTPSAGLNVVVIDVG